MLKSLHLRRNANSAFFPATVSLSMATTMPLVLCNSKPKYLNDWTRSMVVPLYVNSGAALRHFSNTTTLVLLTLMTNCRSTQNSNKTSICFCNPCGVSDINAKSSAYSSNLTTMSASYRHQVHLDASQVHQGRVQKAVGSVDSLVWLQCHRGTRLIALLLDA